MGEAVEVIEQMGGVEVSKDEAPFCHRRIERLAARAKILMPRIYIMQDDSPNACAVALSQNDTAIGVTTGLLSGLDENEIEAVFAHEIGHIQRGHSVEKTKVAMKALAISMTANIVGREVAASDIDLTPADDDSDDLLSTILRVGIGVATAAAGDVIGASTLTSTSLKSEFEADESGAILARKPWALVSALERVQRMTQFGYKKYDPDVSQLFIISPSYLNHKTHPPTSERVARLSCLLAKHPIVARVPTIYCSICGEKSDADGNYCYWCGNELIE